MLLSIIIVLFFRFGQLSKEIPQRQIRFLSPFFASKQRCDIIDCDSSRFLLQADVFFRFPNDPDLPLFHSSVVLRPGIKQNAPDLFLQPVFSVAMPVENTPFRSQEIRIQ